MGEDEDVHRNEAIVPAGGRPCPICGEVMAVDKRMGIQIDACLDHGIWLDAGELPAIIAAIERREKRRRRKTASGARLQGKKQALLHGWWSLLMD